MVKIEFTGVLGCDWRIPTDQP